MTASLSPTFLSSLVAQTEDCAIDNDTCVSKHKYYCDDPGLFLHANLGKFIICIFIFLICLFGFVGNGIVIWLLGFNMKRTPFTTYILNLSIADFGLLTVVAAMKAFWIAEKLHGFQFCMLLYELFEDLFLFMYTASLFVVTVISIDRCGSVLFPIWYRCHRPPYLSTTICALIWVLSILVPGIQFILFLYYDPGFTCLSFYPVNVQRIVNAIICFPLVTISTMILLMKSCCKSQQPQRGKLLTAVLLTLFFFLTLAFPLNVLYYNEIIFFVRSSYLIEFAFLSACLNSSVNPMLYFLVGRKKGGQPIESIKKILQSVFKNEDNCKEDLELHAHTRL